MKSVAPVLEANVCVAPVSPFNDVSPDDGVVHDRTPEPFVFSIWSAVPSALGSVHNTFAEIESGARKPTECEPFTASSSHFIRPVSPDAVPMGLREFMEGKQFVSVGPHGSTDSVPGSRVSPTVKGFVRAAANTV